MNLEYDDFHQDYVKIWEVMCPNCGESESGIDWDEKEAFISTHLAECGDGPEPEEETE